jgi:predicted alpha/beta-fold hydrolase
MALVVILLPALAALTLLLIWIFTRKHSLVVEVNRGGSIFPVIASMASLKSPYSPTPWLLGSTLHTVYAMRYRPRPLLRIQRELLPLDDGGTVCVEVIETTAKPTSPFVLIFPTHGGSSRDSCVANLAAACLRRHWRVAIGNGRGGAGVGFTSARLTFLSDYDHVEAAVSFVREKFHPPSLFVAGFSMGAVQAVRHSCYGKSPIDGLVAISHVYHGWRANQALERPIAKRLFAPPMVEVMRRQVRKNSFIADDDKDFTGVRNMVTFDQKIGHKYRGDGPEDSAEAFSAASVYQAIPLVRAPTLLIASRDDPITMEELLPIKEVRASNEVALVITREGGHVGFLTGWGGKESIVDQIVPEFFEALIRHLPPKQ